MCMQFRVTRRDLAILAVGCLVLSPILIPAGIVGAVGYGVVKGAEAVGDTIGEIHEKHKEKRKLHQATSVDALKRALQLLADKVAANPADFSALFEFAMALYVANDYHSAILQMAQAKKHAAKPAEQAMSLYYLGMCFAMSGR